MRAYVADAVAFLHFLLDDLPSAANDIFKEAENGTATVYLPTIAAAELYYLFEKRGWLKELWGALKAKLSEATTFRYYPLNERILSLFETSKAKEIHDKIILLTAKVLKADALITKDRDLLETREIQVV